MKQRTFLLSALAAFAGGFAAGVVYQSDPFRRVRSSIGASAREHTRWVEEQLHALENQVAHLEDQLHNLGDEFGQRIRDTVQQYVPDLELERKAWEVRDREVERDLPRMPRS